MIVVTDVEANTLKARLQPLRDTYWDKDGNPNEQDPESLVQSMWQVIKDNKDIASRITASGIYLLVGNRNQRDSIRFYNPTSRPFFSFLRPTEKITIVDARHLAKLYSFLLDDERATNAHTCISTIVFQLLFIRELRDASTSDIFDLGHLVTWLGYKHVQDVVRTSHALGL